jgi:hypothetical protein
MSLTIEKGGEMNEHTQGKNEANQEKDEENQQNNNHDQVEYPDRGALAVVIISLCLIVFVFALVIDAPTS